MSNSEGKAGYNEVFISYSRNDVEFAKRFVKAIYDSGYQNIWVDWEDIEYAEDWWAKIEDGIESADNFIFLLSPHSAQSKVCFKEIDYAVKLGKRIIPILRTDISQDDIKQLHSAVNRHNWLPLRDSDDFVIGIETLLVTIKTDLAHARVHTRLITRARDWEDKNYSQSRILTSGELKDAQSWLATSDRELKSPHPIELQREFIESSARFYRRRRWQMIASLLTIFIAVVAYLTFQNIQQQAEEAQTLLLLAQQQQEAAETENLLLIARQEKQNLEAEKLDLVIQQQALARVLSINDFGPTFGWWQAINPGGSFDIPEYANFEEEDGTDYLRLVTDDVDNLSYRNNTTFPADLDIEMRFRLQTPNPVSAHDFEIWLGLEYPSSWISLRFYDEHGPDMLEVAVRSNTIEHRTSEGIVVGEWYTTKIEIRNSIITIFIDDEQVHRATVYAYGEGGGIALVTGGGAVVDIDYLNIFKPESE